MNNYDKAVSIVNAILKNLEGRKGIGNELEEIDEDIYADMKETLIRITLAKLEK